MLELGWLVRTMEALPHWPAVLRAFGSRNRSRLGGGARRTAGKVRCERNPLWNASRSAAGGPARSGNPYRCSGIFLGNSIFAPVLHGLCTAWAPHGHRMSIACAPHAHRVYNACAPHHVQVLGAARLHVLRQLHDLRRCLTLVGEREAATGVPYTHVIHSRLEDVWLRPHSPLALLPVREADGREAVWIPSGEDYYGGINDRHAVMSRAAAEFYLRRWDYVINGPSPSPSPSPPPLPSPATSTSPPPSAPLRRGDEARPTAAQWPRAQWDEHPGALLWVAMQCTTRTV